VWIRESADEYSGAASEVNMNNIEDLNDTPLTERPPNQRPAEALLESLIIAEPIHIDNLAVVGIKIQMTKI